MYQYIAVTDKGITRGNNEDNLLVCQIAQENLGKANLTSDQLYHNHKNHLIAAIADGVGGLTIGERASKLTVDTFVESISESLIKRNFSGEMTSDDTIYNILMDAAREANSKIKCSLLDAGSTLTACLLLDDGHAYVISIGDSRAYIIGAGEEIYQITEDQSIACVDKISVIG